MPITPFHLGPGALLHAAAPRHVSFLAFAAANVLIDLESLVNLHAGSEPVHGFLHSYVGASLVMVVTLALFLAAKRAARFLPNLFDWQALTPRQVFIGAAVGAYSHVLLDSVMHRDMAPFAPFTPGNGLLHFVSFEALHGFCVGAGIVGILIIAVRFATASKRHQPASIPPGDATP